jgi:hypothetical protein
VLLLPVTKSSIMPYLLGVSFERMIRFHRWLGRALAFVSTVHGVLMIAHYGSSLYVFT